MRRTICYFLVGGLVMTVGSVVVPVVVPPRSGELSAGTSKADDGATVGLLIDQGVWYTSVLSGLCEPGPELTRSGLERKLFQYPLSSGIPPAELSSNPELAAATMNMMLLSRWTGQIALAHLDPTFSTVRPTPPSWSRSNLGLSPDGTALWTISLEVAAGFPFRATYAAVRVAPIGTGAPYQRIEVIGTPTPATPMQAMLYDSPLSASGAGFYDWRPLPLSPIWWGAAADVAVWGVVVASVRVAMLQARKWYRFRRNRCMHCGVARGVALDVCPVCGRSPA